MNKRNLLITAAVVVVLIVGIVFNNISGSEKKMVVLGDKSWDSIQVHNRIVAFIIENGFDGYETDFIPGDTVPIVQGVMNGDIDIDMESWHSNFVDIYEKGIESGRMIDLGKNLPDAPQGWYVPRYLVEGENALAPDLKSVSDLPKYANLFPDPEDNTKGIIYGGAAGWGQLPISQEIFDRNGLAEYYNFMVPGSGTALQAPLVAAYEKKEPWVGYYWEPSVILGLLDMVRLEGTEYEAADVNILVNPNFHKESPEIIAFLEKYSTTVDQNNKFLAAKENNDLTLEETAVWFLKNNTDVWAKWLDAKTAEKVKKALK